VKNLNEQQAENDRLHHEVRDANAALVEANKASQSRLVKVIDEEKQNAAEERMKLLSQVSSLINASAETQEKRLSEKVSSVGEEIGAATAAHDIKQIAYNEGMDAWTNKSKDIVVGVSKSRDAVKSRIKSDFAAATHHSTSIKDTTTSVHASTVKIVDAQMAHMDTQLQSLDDIVSRVRAQNNAHHDAHTASLQSLTSTVQSSYSSIGEHLSTSFTRVQSVESDMSVQTTALKDALPSLAKDAAIRAPLHELRDAIAQQNLTEYNPTGETPQRVTYLVPSDLPRTEDHEVILSRMRDRSTSDVTRSPSKGIVFNDATNSTFSLTSISKTTDDFFASTRLGNKPNFSRSISANAASMPPNLIANSSLRELDVNILTQDQSTDLESPTEIGTGAAPPHKKQNRGDGGKESRTGLPMKKMGRKTVGATHAIGDRENLSITSFSTSIGPGVGAGRKLRSHGSS
jgi:kinesin family protein 11